MLPLYPRPSAVGDVVARLPAGYCAAQQVDITELVDGLLAAPAGGLVLDEAESDLFFLLNEAARRSRRQLCLGIRGTIAHPPASFLISSGIAAAHTPIYVAVRPTVAPGPQHVLIREDPTMRAVADGVETSFPWPPQPAGIIGVLAANALFPTPYGGLGDLITRVRRLRRAWLDHPRTKR